MLLFGRLDAEKGWTKQLHLGARRNVNTRMLATLGRDTGYDSIGDYRQVEGLAWYLDRLEQERALPKTILYNNNPADNYTLATMIGNFQDGSPPASCSSAAAGGISIRRTGSSGRSTRCRTSACSRISSAC